MDEDYFFKVRYEDPATVYFVESKGSRVLTVPGHLVGIRAVVAHLSDQDGTGTTGTIYCVSEKDQQTVRSRLSDLFGSPQNDDDTLGFGLEMWSTITFSVMKLPNDSEKTPDQFNRTCFVAMKTEAIPGN